MQVTNSPKRIAIAVNKANLTHDMIAGTGEFTVSVLSQDAPFALFERFGFQSGHSTDKFVGFESVQRAENGLLRLSRFANAFISARVVFSEDCGTHTVFTAEVTEAKVLSALPSVTYDFYFANIKPKPQPAEGKKKGITPASSTRSCK